MIQTSLGDPPVPIIHLTGRCSRWHGATDQVDQILRALPRGGALIIDVGALTYSDMDFLRLLLDARAHHTLVLVGPLCPPLHHRLHTTGTSELFEFKATLSEALTHLRR
ncbi:STAS domain-containing protein [Streptomyces sp. NPDC001904]|uniref:STAS domain-containing protein n=1 Tax=Streptomyces sp. NPDC001904 TaxID=3154531 RepID=UPI00332A1FF7